MLKVCATKWSVLAFLQSTKVFLVGGLIPFGIGPHVRNLISDMRLITSLKLAEQERGKILTNSFRRRAPRVLTFSFFFYIFWANFLTTLLSYERADTAVCKK